MTTAMKPRRAAVVGGGVIGGGWVARLVQNGVDVGIFDPDPEAPRKIGDVMANADHAVAGLTMAPLPERGEMRFAASIAKACLLYTSPSPRDPKISRMPSSA